MISAKETYDFKEPTNRSHPITATYGAPVEKFNIQPIAFGVSFP